MDDLTAFDRARARAKEARREANDLRDLALTARCGLELKMTIKYGTYQVPQHIVMRIRDQFEPWAAEYDAIADQIEADLAARLAPATREGNRNG